MTWITPEARHLLDGLRRDADALGGATATAMALRSVGLLHVSPRDVSKVLAGDRGRLALELLAALLSLTGGGGACSAMQQLAFGARRPAPIQVALPELARVAGDALAIVSADLLRDGRVSDPQSVERLIELDTQASVTALAARVASRRVA